MEFIECKYTPPETENDEIIVPNRQESPLQPQIITEKNVTNMKQDQMTTVGEYTEANANLFIVQAGDKYIPVIEGPTFFCEHCGKRYAWPPLLERHKLECPLRPLITVTAPRPTLKKERKIKNEPTIKRKKRRDKQQKDRDLPVHETSKSHTPAASMNSRIDRYKRRFGEVQKGELVNAMHKCRRCGKAYIWESSLERHIANLCVPKIKKPLICTPCNYRTMHESHYELHVQSRKHARNTSEESNPKKPIEQPKTEKDLKDVAPIEGYPKEEPPTEKFTEAETELDDPEKDETDKTSTNS